MSLNPVVLFFPFFFSSFSLFVLLRFLSFVLLCYWSFSLSNRSKRTIESSDIPKSPFTHGYDPANTCSRASPHLSRTLPPPLSLPLSLSDASFVNIDSVDLYLSLQGDGTRHEAQDRFKSETLGIRDVFDVAVACRGLFLFSYLKKRTQSSTPFSLKRRLKRPICFLFTHVKNILHEIEVFDQPVSTAIV